jgi:predicted DNA-binding protein (MmcQ/YjbR family)
LNATKRFHAEFINVMISATSVFANLAEFTQGSLFTALVAPPNLIRQSSADNHSRLARHLAKRNWSAAMFVF